jgi:hypothetical protein
VSECESDCIEIIMSDIVTYSGFSRYQDCAFGEEVS